ncbi:hypothetical protein HJD18_11335 [Thermoleophilia bacterium SCSIO 60948]|nr:hypothetical protein HJD18_11335 [Thermoleophilia bacterium SCSIO 60948]
MLTFALLVGGLTLLVAQLVADGTRGVTVVPILLLVAAEVAWTVRKRIRDRSNSRTTVDR